MTAPSTNRGSQQPPHDRRFSQEYDLVGFNFEDESLIEDSLSSRPHRFRPRVSVRTSGRHLLQWIRVNAGGFSLDGVRAALFGPFFGGTHEAVLSTAVFIVPVISSKEQHSAPVRRSPRQWCDLHLFGRTAHPQDRARRRATC
ncbi:hypothetical protein [Streptomyces sp. P9-A2]|uniref:hypothetical protein n=1 Tax=Streptomyces sp. P9-A2 TaxID=3072284 RepID=UPI002FC9E86A